MTHCAKETCLYMSYLVTRHSQLHSREVDGNCRVIERFEMKI